MPTPPRPEPNTGFGVGNHAVKTTIAPLFAAATLLLSGGCTMHHEQSSGPWESQVATNMTQANQLVDKGWTVAGFTQYTDATGQPQKDYMMQKPKR